MPKSIFEWHQTVVSHYSDIERFDHAPTVRIMLDQCEEWIATDDKQVVALDPFPEIRENWIADMKDDRARVVGIREALRAWLTKRGLPR